MPIQLSDSDIAYVHIDRCTNEQCARLVSYVDVDKDGRFQFDCDDEGNLLEIGRFKITANVSEYESVKTEIFEVAEDENLELGDILMQPPAIEFSDIQACDIPSNGGECRYSVLVHNNQDVPLKGVAWDFLSVSGTGNFHNDTFFQNAKHRIKIAVGASKVIQFKFNVPNTVEDQAEFCAQIFVSDSASYYGMRARKELFCIEKGMKEVVPVINSNSDATTNSVAGY